MVARENGFLKKCKGINLSAIAEAGMEKQLKNVWAELGQAGRSIHFL